MEDLRTLIDVDVESRMNASTYPPYKKEYENVLRTRQQSRTLPFDARNEVSADARYIVEKITKYIVVLFVLLPVVAGLMLLAASIIK
jgi:hypothetical protein